MTSLIKGPREFLHSAYLWWSILSIGVILSLLVSVGYFVVAPIASILAQQEGEQTASILPEDTEVYLSVNLRPGTSQILKFWSVVNNWWHFDH